MLRLNYRCHETQSGVVSEHMTERPWWAVALQWTVWFIAMSVVMSWLGRSRLRSRPARVANRLAHPVGYLVVGLVSFSLFTAMAVMSNLVPNETATWWTTACFVGFAAISVFAILDYIMAKHEVSHDGLAYRKLLGTKGFLRWSDLRSVRYAETMNWFRLETNSGEVAHISAMLMGLPEFARRLLHRAPKSSMDDKTLQTLKETAKGQPPSLWI